MRSSSRCAGNRNEGEARHGMAIGGEERYGIEIDAEEKDSVMSAALEAKIDQNLKIKEQAELEQVPIHTNTAVLWLKKQHRAIKLYEDIRSTMDELQFKLVTKLTSQTKWINFRYIGIGIPREETLKRLPQLPFPIPESAHPAFYMEFIDSIGEWIGEEKAKSVFDVNIIPASSVCIKDLEGQYPCTWKKEIGLLWYRYIPVEGSFMWKSMERSWFKDYVIDIFGTPEERDILRKSEIQNLLAISKFEEGVDEDLVNSRVVSLWDVTQSCPIKCHSQLKLIMEEMGIKQGNITSFMNQRLQSDGTKYEDISIQEYKLPGTSIRLWLPEKFIVGLHPLFYFWILDTIKKHVVGKGTTRLDIRGTPIALVYQCMGDLEEFNKTLPLSWKGEPNYRYTEFLPIMKLWAHIESLRSYMKEFGVSQDEIDDYVADVADVVEVLDREDPFQELDEFEETFEESSHLHQDPHRAKRNRGNESDLNLSVSESKRARVHENGQDLSVSESESV